MSAAAVLSELDNHQLAALLDGPHKIPALPHQGGTVRPAMKQVRQEAARRLRWTDAYTAHLPEGPTDA